MKAKIVLGIVVASFLYISGIHAVVGLDDLDDLPTAPGSNVHRLIKSHPVLSVGAAISLICIILFKIDPGFKAKMNTWVKKMKRMMNKKNTDMNQILEKRRPL